MKIVTLWESQMQFWTSRGSKTGELELQSGRAFMWYLNRERAAEASPGGPPIERRALERDGLYFLRVKPWYGDVTELPEPLVESDFVNVSVFTADDRCDDTISSLTWEEDMKRRGRL